jgi:hypothetical protein
MLVNLWENAYHIHTTQHLTSQLSIIEPLRFCLPVMAMYIDCSLRSIGSYDLLGRSAPRGRSYYGDSCWELLSCVVNILSPVFSALQTADRATELKLISLGMYKSRTKSFNIMHSILFPLNTLLNSCSILHWLNWLSGSSSLIPGKYAVQRTVLQIHIPEVQGLFLGSDICYHNYGCLTFRQLISQYLKTDNDRFLPNSLEFILFEVKTTHSGASVHQRTIPTERPPLVGEVSTNFSG